MRRRDIELVTALAEGSLADETEARALIERSPRLKAIYDEQRTAIESLASLPEASMTEAEKSALRRDVWTALTTASDTPPERAPRLAWGYAAVFAFVLVGLVAVLSGGQSTLTGAPAELVSEGDSEGAPSLTPGAQARQAELFPSWASSARDGRAQFERAEVAGGDADDWSACEDTGDLRDETYELINIVEHDGARFAVATISSSEIVIVDLDRCEIAYRD